MQKSLLLLFICIFLDLSGKESPPTLTEEMIHFFEKEKVEEIEELTYIETKNSQGKSKWLFSLDERAQSRETVSFCIQKLADKNIQGIVLSPSSSLKKVLENCGYIEEIQKSDPFLVFRKMPKYPLNEIFRKAPQHLPSSVKNIDAIYLINLDSRPEKWSESTKALASYQIHPTRFSAINGRTLSPIELNSVALQFTPSMQGGRWISYFPHKEPLQIESDFLTDECFGKSCVANWMSIGAIGCALSHLSILQSAYDAGLETIWIMEDDILIEKNPHLLSSLIEKLDNLQGKEGWDILYTDSDVEEEGDGNRDLIHDLSHIWRPDCDPSILKKIGERNVVSEDFVHIKSRTRTHSMIVRRSGMQKILHYMKTHLLFLPYDDELSLIPDLKLFNLRYNCVSFIKSGAISDTQITRSTKQLSWPAYKQETLQKAEKISGCHYPPREAKLMDFLYEKKPKSCVEIGAFGGLISYQIAKTLQFLGDGLLHAIDGWDGNLAKEGIKERKLVTFWQTLNMETLYQEFQSLISLNNLEKYCIPIRGDSKKMVSLFDDNSIDFLYIDGNASFEGSLQDVLLYFPKVKEGGYIWFNDACQITKHGSVSFLMSHAKWLKEASLDHQSIVFQKTKKESNL